MTTDGVRWVGAERGQVRDALAAVHNFEVLLRSPRVGANVIAALLPEVCEACAALRAAFAARGAREAPGTSARTELVRFVLGRLDALQRAMAEAAASEIEARVRLPLEQVVTRAGADLAAAFELVELVDRAAAAAPTEVALEELARASLGIGAGIARGEKIDVRVDTREASGVLLADAHVVARLLAAGIARVRASGAGAITVSARGAVHEARVRIAPSRPSDSRLPIASARLPPRLPVTDAVMEQAARTVGADFVTSERALELTLPRTRGHAGVHTRV